MNAPIPMQPFYKLVCDENGKYTVVTQMKPKGWIPDYHKLIADPHTSFVQRYDKNWTDAEVIEAVGVFANGGNVTKWGKAHGRNYHCVYQKVSMLYKREPALWEKACKEHGLDPNVLLRRKERSSRWG